MSVVTVDTRTARDDNYWDVTLASSAARTTSDSGSADTLPTTARKLRFQLDVTAASGTSPTLDVVIEDSIDGTNYNTVGTFSQSTAAGRKTVDVTSPFARQIRARWTIAGTTPSFTFSVRGIATTT